MVRKRFKLPQAREFMLNHGISELIVDADLSLAMHGNPVTILDLVVMTFDEQTRTFLIQTMVLGEHDQL